MSRGSVSCHGHQSGVSGINVLGCREFLCRLSMLIVAVCCILDVHPGAPVILEEGVGAGEHLQDARMWLTHGAAVLACGEKRMMSAGGRPQGWQRFSALALRTFQRAFPPGTHPLESKTQCQSVATPCSRPSTCRCASSGHGPGAGVRLMYGGVSCGSEQERLVASVAVLWVSCTGPCR